MSSHAEILPPPRLGLLSSVAIYAGGTTLLYAATRLLIPFLVQKARLEPIVAWFIAAGTGVFLPLILVATFLLLNEPRRSFHGLDARLWLRHMSGHDWVWVVAGAGVIVFVSAPLIAVLAHVYGRAGFTPNYLAFQPLTPGRYWILAAWLPFFAINMLGEAFVWHSVMLPRQVQSFGERAWLVSGLGWGLFHLALPWQIVLSIAPTLLVIPYTIQRTGNVWPGVLLHVLVNGSGFLAVAFGIGPAT